jgi:sulfotransferase family protein
VAGSARSGTTWLQDLIAAQARFRIMFEPFHTQFGPGRLRSVPAYIRPSLSSPPYLADVEDVLRGRVRDSWIDHCNRNLAAPRRLIKEIDSNLRLGWFRERFPYFPIVFLIRHPLAVAASRGRLGWKPSPEASFADEQLVEDHLAPFRGVLDSCRSDLERRVIQWCIENYVPLSYFQRRQDILVVFYERLVTDVDGELERIADPIRIRVRRRSDVRTPSGTTYRPDGFAVADALDDWRQQLSAKEIERGLEIVSAFGLDALYGPEAMPRDVDPLNALRSGGTFA